MMKMKKQSWFTGPYPWLVSSVAFLLPSINYFIKGDYTGGSIFLVSSMLFLVNFIGRVRKK